MRHCPSECLGTQVSEPSHERARATQPFDAANTLPAVSARLISDLHADWPDAYKDQHLILAGCDQSTELSKADRADQQGLIALQVLCRPCDRLPAAGACKHALRQHKVSSTDAEASYAAVHWERGAGECCLPQGRGLEERCCQFEGKEDSSAVPRVSGQHPVAAH